MRKTYLITLLLLDESFVGELTCLLPEDICVKEMELVPGSFHSRYSAKAKKYKYCIDTRKKPCVYLSRIFFNSATNVFTSLNSLYTDANRT